MPVSAALTCNVRQLHILHYELYYEYLSLLQQDNNVMKKDSASIITMTTPSNWRRMVYGTILTVNHCCLDAVVSRSDCTLQTLAILPSFVVNSLLHN